MKNKGYRLLTGIVLFCIVVSLQALASEIPVTKIGIRRIGATETENGSLEIRTEEGTQSDRAFSYPHGSRFLPGDSAEGILRFQLPSGLEPVTLTLKAYNRNGDAGIFSAVVLQVIEDGTAVYERTLPEFAYSVSYDRTGSAPLEKNMRLKLVFKKDADQAELQKLKGKKLKFELKVTADLTDYAVQSYTDGKKTKIGVYQALYNNRYYYTETGIPSTEKYYAEGKLTQAQEKIYLSDYLVIPGKSLASPDSYYMDHNDGNRRVFIGKDLLFGTSDDVKALTDSKGQENGTNVRRGDTALPAEKQFDGIHYTNGTDSIPGTSDDKRIFAGKNGYGSPDDYYVDDEDGNLRVYAGKDLKFGTSDDVKELVTEEGSPSGTCVLRGTERGKTGQFGGRGHAGGSHYYTGNDGIPGTPDDRPVYAGADGAYGKITNYYMDDNDGDLEVYIGQDLCFGTSDDAKALADRNGKDGTNVLRGTSAAVSQQFGGRDHAGAVHYYSGADGIPGTSDEKEILKGTDLVYGTSDDCYADDGDGDLKVYIGQDLHFGTEDDAKALPDSQGEENGTNVRRGTAKTASEQFGGIGHAGGDHYYKGENGIHGTADDRPVNAGADGIFGTKDDSYPDAKEGLSVFCGQDLHFGTEDDAISLANASNVRRGTAERFGGKNHAEGKHYTNGADGIPGSDPDEKTEECDDDRLIYAGADGLYGTSDDYCIYDARANMRAGKNLIWGDADDELWDIGSDAVHGNWNDRLLGYPNDTSRKDTGNSYSGGAITGSFDSSVSPVGFAKAVEGSWTEDTFGRWSFTSQDGVQVRSKWVNIYNPVSGTSDWFYFDSSGIMQTGWQKINGKYYYFAEESTETFWFWNPQLGKWASSRPGGHPYGSMYRNETTPDGHYAGADGAGTDGNR